MTRIPFLYRSDNDPAPWFEAFREADPALEMRVYPEIGDAAEIVAAFVWRAPAGLLASLPNLKLIHSKGAGVDHIFADPNLPPGVPIVRLIDPSAVTMMAQYAIYHALGHHREMAFYRDAETSRTWRPHQPRDHGRTTVTILGLGTIGAETARQFAALGFRTLGWSRTPKALDGVDCRSGDDALEGVLGETDILVNLLALTPQTENILNAKTFSLLKRGAYLINTARGPHVVDEDLIAAIDAGQLAGATLDVFRTEPLPRSHPFWSHPKVIVTPHVSADALPRTAAIQVAENIRRVLAGEPFLNAVDLERGY